MVRSFVMFATLPLFCTFLACATPHGSTNDDNRVLRVVPQSDLEILDTVWSTAATTRNHGLMIYDTLFGMDSNGNMAPQMVDTYEVSSDRKTWTFTLRPGLEFHDGAMVTSDDVIASLQRWTQRDNMGLVMRSFVERWEVTDANTFRILLKEPYGMMLETLAKTVGSGLFIMPKRVAATPSDRQIDDYTGSGPFIFKRDEWRPGERIVYIKNDKYKARAERPDGTAGGKVTKLDRVEWIVIKDPQTQASALAAGEVDLIESPPFEQYAFFKRRSRNPVGSGQPTRLSHLPTIQPPGAAVRQPKGSAGGDGRTQPASVSEDSREYSRTVPRVFFSLSVQYLLFHNQGDGLHRNARSGPGAAVASGIRVRWNAGRHHATG